ncbi:hypothetical protein VE04_02094 [Pseudogymnoascus sp. 24MN13]|nr:hypothetical protein VE04_02094 [Pseudogymnoascus sp. 24MN13]
MAEAIAGLAVATSIITVVETTSKVVAIGWRCYREIKTAPKELVDVMSELMSLQGILNTLQSHLSTPHDHNSKDFLALEVLNQPDGVLAACTVVLQDVLRIIGGLQKKKISSVIAAATGGQKLLETKSRIERLKSLLMLALSSDHITLSHAIEEHLHLAFGELKHGQEKIHCELLNIDNHITKLSRVSDEIASSQKEKHKSDQYYEIRRWLSTVDFEANHSNACKLQQPGTGLWLIEGKDFSEWARKDHSTFWLHAIPGAGKTILCSTVIQELQSRSQPVANSPEQPEISTIVYFYFDFRNSEQQHTEGMLCSLLGQLANKLSGVPEEICALCDIYKDKTSRPSSEELVAILTLVIQKYFDKVYVALDALDECSERQVLLPILHQLMDSKCASIFLTSRREHDIQKSLSKVSIYSAAIESTDVALDVELFVNRQIKAIESLRDLNVDLQNEIIQELVGGAKGMQVWPSAPFRWVVCQLDALKPLGRPKAIRNALKSLPKTIDGSYDRILLAIQSEEEKELIRRTLQFIIFAIRPMTIQEIADAVVVEDGSTALDPDDRFHTPEHLVKNVRSLLTTTGGYLGLSHYSVQEYLLSPRISKGPASYFAMTKSNADEEIGRICLTYLAYDDFNAGPCKSYAESRFRIDRYPFLKYAAHSWFLHSREEQAQKSVVCLFDKIWTTVESPKYLSWYQAFCNKIMAHNRNDDPQKTTNPPPMVYYPALWGLHVLLERLLIDDANVNIQGGYYGQALQAAAVNQNHQCFEILLDHGADVHAQGGYFGNALQASAFVGCEDMVKALVDRNCNVNTKGGVFGNALYAASSGGHTGTVCMLLEAGADVNAPRETVGHPFAGPCAYPLAVAASNGHYLTCKTLIDKGALVNAQWGLLGDALQQASFNGRTGVVELLLERGAEVNAQEVSHGNALIYACYAGHEQVARLLLIHGADVSSHGGIDNETPLQTAAHGGFPRIVSLLIQYGADANEQSGFYGNALQGAAYRGQERIVETLLSLGADVNGAGGYYGSALHTACLNGSIIVVKMLLNRGADPNFLSDIHGNALQFAARYSTAEIVQLLLERGAKVNALGGKYHTALHAAALRGYENIVDILLMAGADVGIIGGEYGSALDAATARRHMNVVERLRKAEREKEAIIPALVPTDILVPIPSYSADGQQSAE